MNTKFKSKYRTEFVAMLEQHLSSGSSFQSFGGVAKVNNFTLYSWLKKHDDFRAVKEKFLYIRPTIYAASCSGCKVRNIV